jgi:hypothetical protein
LQSGHWTDADGMINVTRADGSTFRAPPSKIGVKGELYTRYELAGQKDLTIEHWFSQQIETPFVSALERLVSMEDLRASPLPARRPDKEQVLRELGFVVPTKVEELILSAKHRDAIDRYLAALLVRNPRYLAKLVAFHDREGTPLPEALPRDVAIKTVALDNMLWVFDRYREQISRAHLGLLVVEGSNEFLFADAGISADEPWRAGPLPFDIHAPLTPKMAIEVMPVGDSHPGRCFIMRVNNRGVARMNRIALEHAQQFVFSRQEPPLKFIKENFGQPAPKSIGIRMRSGRIDTIFDRSLDR